MTEDEEVADSDDFDYVEDIVEVSDYILSDPSVSPSRSEVLRIHSGFLQDTPKVVAKKLVGEAEELSPEKLTSAEKEKVTEHMTVVLKEVEGNKVAVAKKEDTFESQLKNEPQGECGLKPQLVKKNAAPESVPSQSPSPLVESPELKPMCVNTPLCDLPPQTPSRDKSGQMKLPPLSGSPTYMYRQGLTCTLEENELLSQQDPLPSEIKGERESEVKASPYFKLEASANISRLDSLETLLTEDEEVTGSDDEEDFDYVEEIVEVSGHILSDPSMSPSRSEVLQICSGSPSAGHPQGGSKEADR